MPRASAQLDDSPPDTPAPTTPFARADADAVTMAPTILTDAPVTPAASPHKLANGVTPGSAEKEAAGRAPAPIVTDVRGMGIHFPAESNPFPAELAQHQQTQLGLGRPAGASGSASPVRDGASSAYPQPVDDISASMNRSASASSYLSMTAGGVGASHRARPTSPRPAHETGGGTPAAAPAAFASSVGGRVEPRERVTSPTALASFGVIQGTPPVPPHSPAYSPAADGKKEPGVHYDPNRSWAQLYTPPLHGYPLSGGGQAANYGASASASAPTLPQAATPFTESTTYWLGLYFFFNLGLTLFNKVVLVSFPFPYTLTGLHALSGCAGCYIALERGAFTPAHLTQRENLILAAFSVLYTINIAVSNISLQLVTVPFHQVVRASTPLFTIFIGAVFLRQRFSSMKLISLLPVVAGVGFATYGDYYFTAWGLILTLLGTFLAALKTIVTNVIQTGGGGRLKLHPLDLLMRMSPLAFIQCVAYGWYTGELERVRRYGATQMTQGKATALLINGVIACGLNIVSFTANKKAGALTMTVSANCKQVLTIALAVFLFNLHINITNGIGIILTLVGGGWYAYVEYLERDKKRLGKVLGKA